VKNTLIIAVVLASITLLSTSAPAQQERMQTQPKIRVVYNLVSQLSKTCASPTPISQNNCNGYINGVIDTLDAAGWICPGHPNLIEYGPRVENDIAALGTNNPSAISQPAVGVIVSLLRSYGCRITSDDHGTAHQSSSQAEAPDACRDVETYKGKAPDDDSGYLQISWNAWMCEAWANENGNQRLIHDSFKALDKLYDHESAALQTELWPNKNAPTFCRVFQDYQRASHDAIRAGIEGKLPETEAVDNVMRAEQDFLAPIRWSQDQKTLHDLLDCVTWARDSHQTVIALEIRQLISELYEKDAGALPADIEKVAPVCKNADSEARSILDFVGQHIGDDRITPSDAIAYYDRATPLAKCAEQLGRTKYGDADNHLLWALFGINNLMVLANGNAQAKLIHALPPPQPGSPIVINVQNSYGQNPSQNHCTGTVLNLGSISSVDWNCY
jgi:hypothetical protein